MSTHSYYALKEEAEGHVVDRIVKFIIGPGFGTRVLILIVFIRTSVHFINWNLRFHVVFSG